jgi:hypothetical protein
MKIVSLFSIILGILTIHALAAADLAPQTLNCRLKVYNPGYNFHSNEDQIVLEKTEKRQIQPSTSDQLQILLDGDEVTEAYRSRIAFMSSVFEEDGVKKIKIGMYYVMWQVSLPKATAYFQLPVGAPYYGAYAKPIIQTTQTLKTNGTYKLNLEATGVGTSDRVRATEFSCRN